MQNYFLTHKIQEMNKIKIFFILGMLFWGFHSNAQETYNSSGKSGEPKYAKNKSKKGFDRNKLILGGGLSAGASTGIFIIGVSPIVGYKITDRFAAGVSVGYQYQWVKDGQQVMDGITARVLYKNINYNRISPGAWARFIVWNNLFLAAEYEHNIFNLKEYITTQNGIGSRRIWDNGPSLLLGAGLRQPITDNASFVMIVFYDVLQNIESNQRGYPGNQYSISPYANTPGFKVGINIGF